MRYTNALNWRPTTPTAYGAAPLILPQRTALGWKGHVGVRTLKPAAGTTYYVDIVNGNNANPGTNPNAPIQWIWVAMQTAGANLGTLKIAPGIYTYTDGFRDPTAVGALSLTASYSVERWSIRPGPVIITSCPSYVPPATWVQEGGGNTACWTYDLFLAAGASNAITQVVDLSVLTPDGSPSTYVQVASIAACQAMPGSWYGAAGGGAEITLLTIHTLNGEAPGRHILPLQTHTAAADLSRRTVYLDGLTFIGGGSGFIRDNNSGTPGGRLYARDCVAFGCYTNGFQANGLDYSVMENCVAKDNRGDGMVYNLSNTLGTANAVEVGCRWINNGGLAVAGVINETLNGSTAHASSRVTRIGCHAERSQGPNFADTDGCLSWLVGCTAGPTSTFLSSGQDTGFQFTNSGTKAWLLECVSTSCTQDLLINSNVEAYVENCTFGTVLDSSSGAVNSYRHT